MDHGTINATLESPSRKTPTHILLRLRHPTGATIKSVKVNGQESTDFDAARELVRLSRVSGRTVVSVSY